VRGAGRGEAHRQRNDQHQRQQQQEDGAAEHDVTGALDHAVQAHEGRFANGDGGHAAHIVEARLHQVEHVDIGQEIHRSRGVLQFIEQLADARLGRDRLADEDHLDIVLAHIGRDLGHLAEDGMAHRGRLAVIGAVVEKAVHLHEQIRLALAVAGELEADIVGADHDHRAHFAVLALADRHTAHREVAHQQNERGGQEPGQHHFFFVVVLQAAGLAQE
jgi:hypothetical protein